jgi:membrane protein YqaA with SNARE-associated domain
VHTIKAILQRYSAWIWGVLAPLGPWGVFAFAAVDASFLGMPLDAIVAGYVYHSPRLFLFYVLLASAGSALGSSVVYLIGYYGGEKVLRKRISEERFARIHASFEKNKFWALMFPAMLPPPTPFKLFVLGAAVFEMRFTHFLAAIFAGRFVRFLLLSILTIQFGPQVIQLTADLFRYHYRWVLAAVGLGIALFLLLRRRKSSAVTVPDGLAGKTE